MFKALSTQKKEEAGVDLPTPNLNEKVAKIQKRVMVTPQSPDLCSQREGSAFGNEAPILSL